MTKIGMYHVMTWIVVLVTIVGAIAWARTKNKFSDHHPETEADDKPKDKSSDKKRDWKLNWAGIIIGVLVVWVLLWFGSSLWSVLTGEGRSPKVIYVQAPAPKVIDRYGPLTHQWSDYILTPPSWSIDLTPVGDPDFDIEGPDGKIWHITKESPDTVNIPRLTKARYRLASTATVDSSQMFIHQYWRKAN